MRCLKNHRRCEFEMNEFYNKLKYFEETEKKTAEIYYHYTSLEALYSIVTSHTFRLMSLKSSNDKTELYYKPENFEADVTRLYEAEKDENKKMYFGLLKSSFDSNKDKLWKELKAKQQPYALCLSTKKDNLTHWDRYANNCTGVAIGINIKALDVLYSRTATYGFALGLFDLGQALYTPNSIDSCIKYEMIRGFDWLKQLNKTTGDDIKKTIEQSGYLFMGAACRNVMKFAKTQAFFDEDEYRIYFDPNNIRETLHLIDSGKGQIKEELFNNIRRHFLDLVDSLGIEKEEFALTKSGIRGYHSLGLNEIWGSGVIPEIVLGPMCVQNRNELQRFLKANGLEGTKVSISKVPIR